jgi:hypothetical protein
VKNPLIKCGCGCGGYRRRLTGDQPWSGGTMALFVTCLICFGPIVLATAGSIAALAGSLVWAAITGELAVKERDTSVIGNAIFSDTGIVWWIRLSLGAIIGGIAYHLKAWRNYRFAVLHENRERDLDRFIAEVKKMNV